MIEQFLPGKNSRIRELADLVGMETKTIRRYLRANLESWLPDRETVKYAFSDKEFALVADRLRAFQKPGSARIGKLHGSDRQVSAQINLRELAKSVDIEIPSEIRAAASGIYRTENSGEFAVILPFGVFNPRMKKLPPKEQESKNEIAGKGGVYILFGKKADQAVFYIGEAKDLEKRLSNYYTKRKPIERWARSGVIRERVIALTTCDRVLNKVCTFYLEKQFLESVDKGGRNLRCVNTQRRKILSGQREWIDMKDKAQMQYLFHNFLALLTSPQVTKALNGALGYKIAGLLFPNGAPASTTLP